VAVATSDTEPARTTVAGGWAWSTFILPFLEQANLYQSLNPNGNNFPAAPNQFTRTILPVYQCPTEASPALHTATAMGGDAAGGGHARSSYPAVAGSGANADYANKTTSNTKGIMWFNSKSSMRDITDGTSNTMVVAERFWDGGDSEKRRGCIWVGKPPGADPGNVGNKYSNMIRVENVPAWLINGTNNNAAASMHGGVAPVSSSATSRKGGYGIQILLGDGAVRLLSENMNGSTWQAIGQMADGEILGEY
jgi:hypothetical protein